MANNYVYKQFQIKTKEDALLVLGALITAAIVNLEKYDEYTTEAMILSEQYQGDFIPGKEYDDIHDKSLFRQRELLAIMGDQAKDIFSYRTLRDWMLKHDVEGQKLIIRKLEKDVLEVLEDKLILDEMKIDYQDIYDKLTLQKLFANSGLKNLVENCKSPVPIKIITIEETPGMEDIESSIASLSMAIQKRKYDGSDMSYNDYTAVLKTQIRK